MALSNSQYDSIMRIYNQRQLENRHLSEKRREEVLQKAPAFQELEQQIASASISCGRQLLNGDETALDALHAQIDQLRREKQDLLHSLGYPADYLDETYTCPDCKDTGYIDGTPCHCFKQASVNMLYEQSHLGPLLQAENFSTFSFDYYKSDEIDPTTKIDALTYAKIAYNKCQQFAENFDSEFQNLFLQGKTGVGKTFLVNCVAKELLDKGSSVVYFSAHQMFELLAKYTFGKQSDSADYENLYSCDLLIIDDLGTELPNAFTVSQFFLCLNERIQRKKSTIISTNLSLNEIAEIYSERTSSRITSEFSIIKLYGSDIRIKKKLRTH